MRWDFFRNKLISGPKIFIFMNVLFFSLSSCKTNIDTIQDMPSRHMHLPLFNPHTSVFTCDIEARKLPIIDAQADTWFHEARRLEASDIYVGNRDYGKIIHFTRRAAERHHWKAMLNLASLYLEGRDSENGVESAIKIVEEAMILGIPSAYDIMGTYYMNGIGVPKDVTKAYAFWQRAAEMGSPTAMAYLGRKLDAVWDDPNGRFWGNFKIGIQMLECSYSQGNGDAAFELALQYKTPVNGQPTSGNKLLALKFLHEGVKLGSEDSAIHLAIEFVEPFSMEQMFVPFLDKSRGERYKIFANALSFDPRDRFPNLDKVLPLPPARLPPWNGDRDTLLRAARGVTAPAAVPEPTAASQRSGRYFLDARFALRDTGQETQATSAPMEGYWQPQVRSVKPEEQEQLKAVMPGLYRRDEAFASFMSQHGHGALTGIIWRRWDTVRLPLDAVAPLAPVGMTTSVPRPLPLQTCSAGEACPVTGTWQPWVRSDHPLHLAINQYWRQAWLVKGQTPPDPQRDWHLPIAAADVTWHLMDSSPVNLLKDVK